MKILSALYGCSRGGADVTTTVATLIKNGNDDIKATNSNLGGDPCKGYHKFFAIEYELDDGTIVVKCIRENETIDLV